MSELDLANLSIYPATAQQILETRHRTHAQWGRGSTLQQYLERDELMDKYEHAAGGKLITWVLASRDDPESLEFKCSCETFQRPGVLKKAGGLPEVVVCYGVASVYTPPQNRGRGYASRMMSLLHWVIAVESGLPKDFPKAWGSPPNRVPSVGNGIFSALWSDVGPDFYRRCGPSPDHDGWVIRDSMSTIWTVRAAEHDDAATQEDASWTWLNESQLDAVWEADSKLMQDDISASTSPSTLISFLPHQGVAAVQYRRVPYFIRDPNRPNGNWGIVHSTGEVFSDIRDRTFATWTLDVGNPVKTLLVTRFRAKDAAFPLLLRKILEAARKWEVEVVEIWNLPVHLRDVAAQQGGQTKARDEHLSSLMFYGDASESVEWVFNEKFCWC